jgi:hypothetical protein
MSEGQQAALFCMVANVAEETAHGEGGLELRQGLRHFAAGAKVWVLPPQWGDWSCMVSDPPPQELSRDGRTYYLAHFNANRAIYSAESPPAEQATSR